MNSKKFFGYCLLGIFIVGAFVSFYLRNKWYHQNIRSYPQAQPTSKYAGDSVAIYIVTDFHDCDKIVQYYQQIERGNKPNLTFKALELNTKKPIYVLDYSLDSLSMEVVSYSYYGFFHMRYVKGWVYSKCLQIKTNHE